MMFEYSFGRPDLARQINDAVSQVLDAGYRTADIAKSGSKTICTKEFTARIQEQLK